MTDLTKTDYVRFRIWDLGPQPPPDTDKASPEWAAFEKDCKKFRGPVEMIDYWSVDARDAIQRDPKRYALSNPEDMLGDPRRKFRWLDSEGNNHRVDPGPAQIELEERIRAQNIDRLAALRMDPQFGQQRGMP